MTAGMKQIKWSLIFLFMAMTGLLQAQDEEQLPGQNLTVISEIRPVLQEAEKVRLSPALPRVEHTEPDLEYIFEEKQIEVAYEAPEVRPLAVKAEALEPLPHAFVKVGFGNVTTPMAEVYLNSGRKQKYRKGKTNSNYGAAFKYISQKSARAEQLYSDFRSRLFADFYTDAAYFSPYIGYSRDGNRFYGYDPATDTVLAALDNKQVFNYYYGGLKFGNPEENDAKIDFDGELRMAALSDYLGQSEVNPVLGLKGSKELDNSHRINAGLRLDYSRLTAFDTLVQTQLIFGFHPSYLIRGDVWFAELGLRTGSDDHGFFLYPDLRFERQLMEESLVFSAAIRGQSLKNNFKTLSDENPYLQAGQTITSSRNLEVGAGLSGVPFRNFSYRVEGSYTNRRFMPYFMNDTLLPNRFNVIYDTATSIVKLHAELGYELSKKMHFLASGDFYKYSTSEQFKPWYKPSMKFSLLLQYYVIESLRIEASVNAFSKMWARDDARAVIRLPGLVDINLGADYKINESFHIFVHVNNLSSVKYQRWYRYPGYGINGVGGIKMIF